METFWKAWCVVALWTSVSAMEMLEDWTMTSQYRGLQTSYENCKKFSYRASDDGCNKCICFADRWNCAKEPCSEKIGCTDFYSECKRFKEQAGCTRYWMKKICPKTCDACNVTDTSTTLTSTTTTPTTTTPCRTTTTATTTTPNTTTPCRTTTIPTTTTPTTTTPCKTTTTSTTTTSTTTTHTTTTSTTTTPTTTPSDLPCKCGIPNRKDIVISLEKVPRIIGGEAVAFARKYPWQVSLQQWGQKHRGGGSIINDRWILTAAHVIIDVKSCTPFYDRRPFYAFVGEHDLYNTSDNSSDTRIYDIKQYIPHPKFVCKTFNYDFALLELIEPIPFNDVIRPICLPEDDSKNYVGETGTVIGWGRISSEFHYYAKILQELNVKIHANTDCQKWNTDHYSGPIPSNQMCVAHAVYWNKTACHGDSGGPLFVYEKNRYVQVGIVSHGMSCHTPDYPGIFARVTTVLEWISTTTTNGKKCVN